MSETTAEYDYVIVGSEAAGSVIARRLIDAGAGTVAVLESGGDDQDERILDPKRTRELPASEFDWAFRTEPQEGLNGRRVDWPRGRVLGGSSSLNLMIYVRGHRLDYDTWEYAGNYGWGWDDVLPLFKRSEDYAAGESEFHGTGGPLRVERVGRSTPLSDAFIEACRQQGIPDNDDFNGVEMMGVNTIDVNIDIAAGRRLSTATTFLRPVMDRPELDVILGVQVDKIVLDNGRATGIEYISGGTRKTVRARQEVVLAGGVIGSPAILLRSGIGAADQLRELGIEPVVDLPGVGENLHDHAISMTTWEATRPVPLPPAQLMDTMFFWASNPAVRVPQMQPMLMHFVKPIPGFDDVLHGFTIPPGIVRVQSRGRLWLTSTDPFEPPAIDPAYLQERADVDALVDAIELCRDIGHSPALDEWRAREIAPGPSVRTRVELEEWARNTCGTYHHQVGTCKMGVDSRAVVDPELRVYGVDGLRVTDALIIPVIPSVNTHAPSIMIGEKASDLLLASVGMSVAEPLAVTAS